MAQADSNSEDDLDGLVGRVKSRRAEGRRPFVPTQQLGGLRPSEILFMSGEQKKLIYYLSHQQYARIEDIERAIELDQAETLKILSVLKDEGYVHEVLVNGEILYRVKFVDTSKKNNRLPQELLNALSIDSDAFLHQLPLFKKLAEMELGFISQKFKQEHYARNDVIVRQGEPAKSFFIIKSGVVAVSNLSSSGVYNLIRYLEQGDFFGESGLLTGQSTSATIIAFTPVDILVVNKDDFYTMLAKHVGIAIELARTLAYRLSDMNTRLANKLIDSSLFLVVSTGKQSGASTIANAMALMIAASTKASTGLLEFPGKELPVIYDFPPTNETYDHPGGFQILNPRNVAKISEIAQATLVMDQVSAQFKNIVICISWELAQQLDALIRSASQIVMVTSPHRETWEHTKEVIASLKPYIRANKTRLFTLVNHTHPDISNKLTETTPDFAVPFLSSLPAIAERRVENLPEPLTTVISAIFDLLGYTNQIGVYLPTTIGVDQRANTSAYVEKTLSFMGKIFGGATHEQVQGVWNSQDAGLVGEDIHLVRSFCSQSVLDKHMGEVVDYVEILKQELQQEAMALEVNQKLMLI
jgi:CRP-like cAMP-binding protein